MRGARRVGIASALALGAVLVAGCGADKNAYMKANEQLLALAKPYPGAEQVRLDNASYHAPDSEYGPTIGYTTVVSYALTRGVHQGEIEAFYRRELRGWQERIVSIPCLPVAPPPGVKANPAPRPCGSALHVAFAKGKAHIELDLGIVRPDAVVRSYNVSVDHAAASSAD